MEPDGPISRRPLSDRLSTHCVSSLCISIDDIPADYTLDDHMMGLDI
jgi:hypothetical protein